MRVRFMPIGEDMGDQWYQRREVRYPCVIQWPNTPPPHPFASPPPRWRRSGRKSDSHSIPRTSNKHQKRNGGENSMAMQRHRLDQGHSCRPLFCVFFAGVPVEMLSCEFLGLCERHGWLFFSQRSIFFWKLIQRRFSLSPKSASI